MQRFVWGAALTIGLLISPTVGQPQALHCEDLDPTVEGDATRAFECVSVLDARLNAALSRIRALEDEAHEVPAARLVPKGAVLAFDTPDGCPEGWSHFAEAQSRVLVGASVGEFEDGFDEDEAKNDLSGYKYRDHKGFAKIMLTIPNMPSHDHDYKDIFYSEKQSDHSDTVKLPLPIGSRSTDRNNDGLQMTRTTETEGGSKAFSNMPPFVALYFCKKD